MRLLFANSSKHIQIARELFREYQTFLGVDLCFQGFEEELANLPGKYAEPIGAIILAEHDGQFIGCVAVRPIKDAPETCEMKRLYVKDGYRGLSAGRKLAEAIITKSRELGYKTMQLDTLERLDRAMTLYEKLGFKKIQPYYANPLSEVVYWELDLHGSPSD